MATGRVTALGGAAAVKLLSGAGARERLRGRPGRGPGVGRFPSGKIPRRVKGSDPGYILKMRRWVHMEWRQIGIAPNASVMSTMEGFARDLACVATGEWTSANMGGQGRGGEAEKSPLFTTSKHYTNPNQ